MPAKKASLSSSDQEYASFLRGIQLLGLAQQESRTFQNRDLYFELSEKKRLTRRISAEYRTIDVEKDFFNASAKLTLTVEDSKGSVPTVLVECTYVAHFHCDGCKITRQLAERFTEAELRIVLWPYFRQFVTDATSRMAIQPILIPFTAVA